MQRIWLLILLFLSITSFSSAQKGNPTDGKAEIDNSNSVLQWRCIGPFRGGRSAAVTGVPGHPNLFYMGTTGGGVWRTQDGGQSWQNISDGYFGGSIGAVAVSEYDPNVIYVGGGEVTVRGNVSSGNGIWKSTDAGKTWQHKGLDKTRHIPRIHIHPRNPDIVYAAALGNIYTSTPDRGVYKSTNGGESWKKVLFSTPDAGAVDLILDPGNPRILYASTWRVRRTPYSLESGGEGSGLWKSTDSGENWKEITRAEGLPRGTVGIIGVTVSPANPNRVYALIEARNGGLFRSENGGESWKKINEDRSLRQRAWYYTRIYADPTDEDIVYVMNVSYHKSKDGGKSFKAYNAPHGDHHDLWIAPEDNQRMIIGDDGGAQISFDGGENWSTYENQPTAQFYRVILDENYPIRAYGAQQDNSAIRIQLESDHGVIDERHWESTAGGESAHLAYKPDNPEIVVGGSYDGYLTWLNHATRETRAINVWPDNPMGHGAEDMKYRFQWNFPVFFSPNDPNTLYAASNHLHKSTNMGQSWEVISPDLTRNDTSKLHSSGGPITKDNTSVEYYCTIFAAAESAKEPGLLWAGSDDGLIHISRDGGKNWENVTPKKMPEWSMVNSVDIHPEKKGGAYIAATLYKTGDFRPMLFKTEDYGKTWEEINAGIDPEHFTRVVRADPYIPGLLYAGTESGMYYSKDDGASWQPFQFNLPIVPITDLAIRDNHLVAATQGRSFWVFDYLHILRQQVTDPDNKTAYGRLYQPEKTFRGRGYRAETKRAGTNPYKGAEIFFEIFDKPDTSLKVSLEILRGSGEAVRTYSTHPTDKEDSLKIEQGMNHFVWDLHYPKAKGFDGMVLWWASLEGPKAIPGFYTVRLTAERTGQKPESQSFNFLIDPDPRSTATQQDFEAQFEFLTKIRDTLTMAHLAIQKIRDARSQINGILEKHKGENSEMDQLAKEILKDLKRIEETLYQTQNRSGQDPLNFPIRLTNKLGHLASLVGMGDFGPTEQDEAVRKELTSAIQAELIKLGYVLSEKIGGLNRMIQENVKDFIQPKVEE